MSESVDRVFSYKEIEDARDKYVKVLETWPRSMRRLRFGTGLAASSSDTTKSWHLLIIVHKERHLVLADKLAKKYIPGIPTEIRFSDYPVAAVK